MLCKDELCKGHRESGYAWVALSQPWPIMSDKQCDRPTGAGLNSCFHYLQLGHKHQILNLPELQLTHLCNGNNDCPNLSGGWRLQ